MRASFIKSILVIVLCLCIAVFIPGNVFANDSIGNVQTWNCDSYTFYYLESVIDEESISWKTDISENMSTDNYRYALYSGITNAVPAWLGTNTSITIDSNPTSSTSFANVTFYLGDRSDMENIVPNPNAASSNASGYTYRGAVSSSYLLVDYGTNEIELRKVPSTNEIYCFVWEPSLNQYQAQGAYAHEFGHALGWQGHYTESTNDLMASNITNMTGWGTAFLSPSTYDCSHLRTVYNILRQYLI